MKKVWNTVQFCPECDDNKEFEFEREEDDIDHSYYSRRAVYICTECGLEITLYGKR